jgi:hypothetical protein
MPGGENGKKNKWQICFKRNVLDKWQICFKRNELAICVFHWSIPCAASSTIRTRVPQFKASAAAILPSLY